MVGEFFSAIPGERLIEFVGQFSRLPDQRCYDGFGVAIGDLGEQHIAGVPLDQGDDEAIFGSAKEIALPMAGYGAIFRRSARVTGTRSWAMVSVSGPAKALQPPM